MSAYTYRIAQIDDVENVHRFEVQQRFPDDPEAIENKMQIWNSAYRLEALQHYFKLGWSFIGFNQKNEIVGFFMGQPLLFLDHQTQTLWVEYVSAVNDDVRTELIDIAYRLSREKHFQRVLLSADLQLENLTKPFPFQRWERSTSLLKTTK